MKSILTVVTPAYSVDLTILANVKAELGITTTSEDARLETWIDQASGLISAACNRVFGSETVKETFRIRANYGGGFSSTYYGTGDQRYEPEKITLERTPVTAFTSVIENGLPLTRDVDYECDPESGILTRLSNDYERRWCFRTLAVTYTGGYDLLGTLPLPIERAAITLVKQYRSAATRDPMLKSEDIPGVLNQTFWVGGLGEKSNGLPLEVETMIAPYRNFAI